MKIIVINCGSSSLKFKLFDMTQGTEALMAEGVVEEIGRERSKFSFKTTKSKEKVAREVTALDHTQAVAAMKDMLLDPVHGLFREKIDVDAVGHRVVHGAEKFSRSALVTPGVKAAIQECVSIAPLHNPPNLAGICACEQIFPGVPQVAVFDTAFHQTMKEHVYIYGLPYEQYERYHIRKYGFHGTSHEFVARRAAELLGRPFEKVNLITCHLGNGGSITAIKNGQSYDTSMGYTPLEGLVMGTRSGDIDPALVLFLMEKEKLSGTDVNVLLNTKSGLKGISGVSNDLRQVMEKANQDHHRARLAIDVFCYRITKYIGAYAAAMGGVDAIVFTGGIGENSAPVRAQVLSTLGFMGVTVSAQRNTSADSEKEISTDESRVKALVIPTNEELAIARQTKSIVEQADHKYH